MFNLVYRINQSNIVITTGTIFHCQKTMAYVKKLSLYNKGKLVIRTQLGLKNNPNWDGKKKKQINQ